MRIIILFTALIANFTLVLGQNPDFSKVSGVITDSKGERLVNAVVTFCLETDSLKQFPCICDIDGYFSIEVPKGAYQYAVSYMGQEFRNVDFRVEAHEDHVTIPPIVLDLKDFVLDEVVVKANRPFVTYQGNNAVYNLAAHRGAAGGSVLDGLRFIPGMQVDGEEGLSVFGFYKVSVAVNGRLLKLTDEQVKAYLSTFGTADIEHVELIRNPGPEYGFQSGAVLNVVTKKKADEGVNAFLSASLIYRQKLSEQATGRLNFNKGKWRNYVAYHFADNRRKETLDTSIGNDTTIVDPQRSHLLQFGSELQITPKQLAGMRIYGTKSNEKLENTPHLFVQMKRLGGGANLYHSVRSKALTWNVNADYAYRDSKRKYQREDDVTDEWKDVFHYLRASTDVIYQLTPVFTFQMGGSWTKSDIDTRSEDNLLGTTYEYEEKTTSAYVTLRYRDQSIDAYGGVQGNYDDWTHQGYSIPSDKATHLWAWQPYFSMAYNLSQNHRFTVNFQTYYQRPNFRDLQPYTSSSSSILKRKGNPDLKNSTRYNLSLNYTFLRAAMLEINLSSEKNPIVETIARDHSNYYISKINLDNSKYLRVLVGAPVPIMSKNNGFSWLATTYLAYHWQWDKGIVNEKPYKSHFNAYYVQHKQSVYLPNEWAFEAQVSYYSPLTAGLYLMEKQWWMDFVVSKRVDNWKFSITGYDIFNSNVAKGHVDGLDTPVYFTKNWHSPKITLNVSLTLGNSKLKTSNRRNVDADSRLKQSADEGMSIGEK